MSSFFLQIFTVLTSETGSLTYHLILAFSIVWALQGALHYRRAGGSPSSRRMVFGLGLLLAVRLALFVIAGLAWQGLIDADLFLPPIDRAATLASLLLVVWLWAFPEPLRAADTAAVLVSLLTITLVALGLVWWSGEGQDIPFNGSRLDMIAESLALFLVIAGAFLLLFRRPAGWPFGLSMLVLLFLGHLAHILSPFVIVSDFPAAVRLAQMAAFPLLIILPQRFAIPAETPPADLQTQEPEEKLRARWDLESLQSLLDVAIEAEPQKLYQVFTRNISLFLHAEVCLWVAPVEAEDRLEIQSGYNLIHAATIPKLSLNSQDVPGLSSTLRQGKSLRLSESSSSKDLTTLASALSLDRSGPLLAVPVKTAENGVAAAIVLLSPYLIHGWEPEDATNLKIIAGQIANVLHQHQEYTNLENHLNEAQRAFAQAQNVLAKTSGEREQLLGQVSRMKVESDRDRAQLESLAALLTEHAVIKQNFDQLQAENENLKKALHEAAADSQPVQPMDGDLRIALEEISSLKASLAQAEQKIATLPVIHAGGIHAGGAYSREQVVEIQSITHELRQPMTSIVGYTEFLLSESIGILGTGQRRLMERIKASIERMTGLIDKLAEIVVEGGRSPVKTTGAGLPAIAEAAIWRTQSQFEEKQVSIARNLASDLPLLNVDSQTLEQVMVELLQNAIAITPAQGEIAVHACVERSEKAPDYVMLQITDQGGGIPWNYLPRLFSSKSQDSPATIPGIAKSTAELSAVRLTVEGIGGRIWVNTERGKGATFTILLPISDGISAAKDTSGSQP